MSEERVTVDRYLELPETNRPMELLYGVVREPPAPNFAHQRVLMRLSNALDRHVARFNLGRVCISPIDVILNKDAALVLQPDLIFIATARLQIVKDRVWGAPDLTVEVLSPGTIRSDRNSKLECYRRYGVRESWLVDPDERTVEVCNLADPSEPRASYSGDAIIRSYVLPRLRLRTSSAFEV